MNEIERKRINEFAEIVREFCRFSETDFIEPVQATLEVCKLLTRLYLAALYLPNVNVGKDLEGNRVSNEKWKEVFDRFQRLSFQFYWEVFDPLEDDNTEAVCGHVADDIADIYRDLKSALVLFEQGNFVEAVWEWRFNFFTHWGEHVVSALRPLHSFQAK